MVNYYVHSHSSYIILFISYRLRITIHINNYMRSTYIRTYISTDAYTYVHMYVTDYLGAK